MSMKISIIILFVAQLRHNMQQLLDRKIFRQFFHMPLTGLNNANIDFAEPNLKLWILLK